MSAQESYPGMSLHVSIYVSPSHASAFLDACKPCFEAVSREPECTYFELFTDPDDPGHFHWVENWTKDKKWFLKVRIRIPHQSLLVCPHGLLDRGKGFADGYRWCRNKSPRTITSLILKLQSPCSSSRGKSCFTRGCRANGRGKLHILHVYLAAMCKLNVI
ncbi:MAG: hypothetical protein Q9209_006560 [Squamulea sp. 1 TL-2023]